MVSDLDAHSQYLDAGEYRDIRISTTGSYTGIGIEIDEVDGKVLVVAPFAGSPAARSTKHATGSAALSNAGC